MLWPDMGQFRQRSEVIAVDEARDRMPFIQSIESLRCLAESVVQSQEEANLDSIYGVGFPRHTGGTLQFIYGIEIDAFINLAKGLAARWGDRFHLDPEIYDVLACRSAGRA